MTANKLEKYLNGYTDVKINDFSIDVSLIERGIIFFYCTWSYTFIQLEALISSLKYCSPIPLFIFDTSEEDALLFLKKEQLPSHGWGETYWVKNGKIISFHRKYGLPDIEQLINNNSML